MNGLGFSLRRAVPCLSLSFTVLVSLGAACTNTPMTPGSATLASPGKCSKVAVQDGKGKLNTPFQLCVENIDRGWFRFDWSRVSLVYLDERVKCVRLTQSNGYDLGYAASGDRPNRPELELTPVGQSVSFMVSDAAGDTTDTSQALGNALGDYDLQVALFDEKCQQLCRASRGDTIVTFANGQATPTVRFRPKGPSEPCALIGSRAPATWNHGGAAASSGGASHATGDAAGGEGGAGGGNSGAGGS